jgi:hypothetical protein
VRRDGPSGRAKERPKGSPIRAKSTENKNLKDGNPLHGKFDTVAGSPVIEGAKQMTVITSEGRTLPVRVIRDAYEDPSPVAREAEEAAPKAESRLSGDLLAMPKQEGCVSWMKANTCAATRGCRGAGSPTSKRPEDSEGE